MSNEVAIITGAGSGIGQATALELSLRGFAIVLVGRNRTTLDQTASQFQTKSLVLQADVAQPASADTIISETLQHFSRLDALVNNAGYAPLLPIEQVTDDEWHKILETNLSSAFRLTRAAWPHFVRQNHGIIVNISSESARDPLLGFAAYGAAKAALELLGKSLGKEGAPHNIRIHTIAPAAVETPMFRKLATPEQYPTEKTLTPTEVAKVTASCIVGDLKHTSGEVIRLHRTQSLT